MIENQPSVPQRRINYWSLWLFDTVLVCAGVLFCLALQYGTYEFFGRACAMALLPFIPVIVLVGGAGSTIFALSKVWIEKRALPRPTALTLLIAPAVVVTLLLVAVGLSKSPGSRLSFICLGSAPATASHVRVAGYSTFLRSEWLAVFSAGPQDFQALVTGAKLVPAEHHEFTQMLERSAHLHTRLYRSLPTVANPQCYKRVFQESKEHQRGGVYAVFDPATQTVMVFREYHD